MRRSSLLWIVLVCSALAVGGEGQGLIHLVGGAGQAVTFTGMGAGTSAIAVSLGNCAVANTCMLNGTGTGYGTLSSAGVFLIESPANSVTLVQNNSGNFDVEASAPMQFPYYGIAADGQMGLLLSGDLNLVDFTMAGGNEQGYFGEAGAGSLTITGGALAGEAASTELGMFLGVEFNYGPAQLGTLIGTSNSINAYLTEGTIGSLPPTPEPSSLLLAGLGLLLLVATCGWRRRRGQTSLT